MLVGEIVFWFRVLWISADRDSDEGKVHVG
jgi:hypothetical protein